MTRMGRPAGRPECKVDGCTSPNTARGWCNLHYRRWQRSGDPLKAAWERGDSAANFWAKVRRSGDTECWPWQGYVTADGYGIFVSPRGSLAHRFSYELHAGEIAPDMEIDHVCHSGSGCTSAKNSCPHRRCVNPAHLEVVTHDENSRRIVQPVRIRRGAVAAAKQRAKTHCPRDHEYTIENTYVDKRGSRNCRACAREKARRTDRRAYRREYYLRTKTT